MTVSTDPHGTNHPTSMPTQTLLMATIAMHADDTIENPPCTIWSGVTTKIQIHKQTIIIIRMSV